MDLPVLELWYKALHEPLGLVVTTNDAHRLQQKLYAARKKANDPSLDDLKLVISPTNPQGELIIARKTIEADDA